MVSSTEGVDTWVKTSPEENWTFPSPGPCAAKAPPENRKKVLNAAKSALAHFVISRLDCVSLRPELEGFITRIPHSCIEFSGFLTRVQNLELKTTPV
ncbi:hypothetical protein TUMSATVNIG3_55160 [Vibrio nigripulchritudo]|nr:hypothetical protein TUMSATVNIG2_54470 [Vibrio nigripulchritudo]BDU46718.1 hypothetical protein TUMSATVNIG3_55160 [Vibrio nigripulchritudo]